MSASVSHPLEPPSLSHESTTVLSSEDTKIKCLVVAVHGIGSQFRYATVQSVASRFAAYFGKPMTLPLGAFHPAKIITKPDSPELGAYLYEPPPDFQSKFGAIGFAEVFWADIPERAAETNNTTEESKAWAQTIVDRVRRLDESSALPKTNLIDYKKAAAVVAEMIDTIAVLENILFIARKAGLFDFKLDQLLTDFLGDVQIVADFKDYGGDVFKRFGETMGNLVVRMPQLEEIYVVAHSEGTVVSLRGLLLALACKENQQNAWVNKVKGYMTIGSPLNKHIVLWPKLWQGLTADKSRDLASPILWRNYYDFGDPVGFDLRITRDWLKDNGWLPKDDAQEGARRFFQFRKEDDCGFARYPFPGKAHNDYWKDPDVFAHFIDEVIFGKGNVSKPRGIWWVKIVSWVVPYIICLAILATGTYVLYKTLINVLGKVDLVKAAKAESTPWEMIGNVTGITCFLAGITLFSRMPRLDKIWPPWPGVVIGGTAFIVGVVAFLCLVADVTQHKLNSAFWDPHYGIVWAGLLIGIISAALSKRTPQAGMAPLIWLAGVAAVIILRKLLSHSSNYSLWPLVLATAGFLYLWWLSALLFDLFYIWHQFIRSPRTTDTLQRLRNEAPTERPA